MKKIFYVILLLASNLLNAQAPQAINYQAVYRNANGFLVKNQSIIVECSVREGSASGTILYSETHNVSTNDAGLFTISIGEGTNTVGVFSNIKWWSASKWCEIKIGSVLIGAFQLKSVPYALYAERVGTELYVFEEKYAKNVAPGTASGGAIQAGAFNTRLLNTNVYSSSKGNVTLGSNGLMTFTPGTYLIQASAPSYAGHRHQIALRKSDNTIVLEGTSTFSESANGLGDATRSIINSVLVVPEGSNSTLALWNAGQYPFVF